MTIHRRGVDDLAGQHRHAFAQHDRGRIAGFEFDAQMAFVRDDRRALAFVEIAALHVRHM